MPFNPQTGEWEEPNLDEQIRRSAVTQESAPPVDAYTQAAAPNLPQIFNRVPGPPDAQGNDAYQEDTRGPVNFRPFEPGVNTGTGGTSESGTVEGPGVDFEQQNQMRAAYFQRRELFPDEPPQQTVAMLAASAHGDVAPDFSPEGSLAQIQNRIAGASLSHGENLMRQRLENSASSIQTMMASGQLSAEDGAAMMAQVHGRLQPLMVRQSQLPLLHEQLRLQRMRIDNAHQASMQRQNEIFHSQGGPITIERQGVHYYHGPHGWQPVPQSMQPQAQEQRLAQQTQQQTERQRREWNTVFQRSMSDVNREMTAYNRATGENRDALRPEWLRDNLTEGPGTLGRNVPVTPQMQAEREAMRRATERFGGPRPGAGEVTPGSTPPGEQPQTQQPSEPSTPQQAQQMASTILEGYRQVIRNAPASAPASREELTAASRAINQIHEMVQRRQTITNFTPEERQRYDALVDVVRTAVARSRPQAAPTVSRTVGSTPFGSSQPGYIGGR